MNIRFLGVNKVHFGLLILLALFLLSTFLWKPQTPPEQRVNAVMMFPTVISTVPVTISLPTVTVGVGQTPTGAPTLPVGQTPTLAPTAYVGQTVTAEVPHIYEEPSEEVRRANFGSWNYKAGRMNDGSILATIGYDSRTLQALETYAIDNRLLANQLASLGRRAEAYVTFRTYMAPDQFRVWVNSIGAHVNYTELRFVAIDGVKGFIGIDGVENDPLPQTLLEREIEFATSHGHLQTLPGVYFAYITVDAIRLPQIAADPLVYLADVTPEAVRQDLAAAGVQGAEQASVVLFPPSPFWKMENDFGLENFEE